MPVLSNGSGSRSSIKVSGGFFGLLAGVIRDQKQRGMPRNEASAKGATIVWSTGLGGQDAASADSRYSQFHGNASLRELHLAEIQSGCFVDFHSEFLAQL